MKAADKSACWPPVFLLGAGHGIGDFNAGVLLAQLGSSSGSDLVITYLIYNALAFAGQPFAGMICDRIGGAMGWFYFGGILSALSLVLADTRPELAVIGSGLASAFYHSAGGAVAWRLGGQRALAAGCFAAPGVVGLALGLAIGSNLTFGQVVMGGGMMVVVLALLFSIAPKEENKTEHAGNRPTIDRGLIGGVLGWLVILAIAARSFAWSIGQDAIFPPEYAVWLALAAAGGKCVAGFLADRLGLVPVACTSLLVAALLLFAGKDAPIFFFPAVTALQAATAPMMALIFRAWPRHPAFGSGLAQGLAVAVGGAPLLVLSHVRPSAFFAAIGALVLAAVLVFAVNYMEKSGSVANG